MFHTPGKSAVLYAVLMTACSLSTVPLSHADAGHKKVPPAKKPPVVEPSKGTQQMKGGDGVFGVVYTMRIGSGTDYNVQFIKARYTLEPHNDYNGTMPGPNEKLFVLTFAVKNPNKDRDLDLGGIDIMAVDENENDYQLSPGTTRIAANGAKEAYIILKPGQGIGQDPVTNELSLAIVIPGGAKIKKIILKGGRSAVPDEKVLRFPIAGATGGVPKNVIAPLPAYAADPADPSGATALEIAPAVIGKYYPDGYFAIRLDGVTFSTDMPLNGALPPEGKQWAIATFTAKNIYSKTSSTFDLGSDEAWLRDSENEKYTFEDGKRKATRDESATSVDVDKGEEVKFRHFFAVPKDVKLKSLLYPPGKYGHSYQWDLTAPQ